MEKLRVPLALRLSKCIGGLHFQVADRALVLWNTPRFVALVLENPVHRPVMLRYLFPVLYDNQHGHWHENIRLQSGSVLELYCKEDPAAFAQLRSEHEARLESSASAGEAAEAAAAAAAAGRSPAGGADLDAGARAKLGPPSPGSSAAAAAAAGASSSSSHGHHKAAAVRGSSSLSANPDLLPGSREHTPKKGGLRLPMPLGGAGEEGGEE